MTRIILAAVFICTTTASAYLVSSTYRDTLVEEAVALELEGASDLIYHDLRIRIASVERMADDIAAAGGFVPKVFDANADQLIADLPGFFALTAVDRDFAIETVRPSPLRRFIGMNVGEFGPDRTALAVAARDGRATQIGNPLEQRDGAGTGFLTATPIFAGDEFLGLVWVVLNANQWIDNLYFGAADSRLRGIAFRMELNGEPLYQTADFSGGPGRAQYVEAAISNATFGIYAKPRTALSTQTAGGFVPVVTIATALLSMAVALALVALLRSRSFATALGDTNLQLERANTVERNLREELQQRNDSLEVAVAERTRQIEEQAAKVEDALKAQLELNNLQRTFVSMASHELRTPLTIIDGAASGMERRLARGQLSDGYVTKNLDQIRKGVARMVTLMENTLAAARAADGKISIETVPLDPAQLIAEVCTEHATSTSSHRIAFQARDLPPTIAADPRGLTQIMSNLISNAVKYSPNADRVEVTAVGDGNMIEIGVRDYGLGIPEAEVSRLFDRFFRASTSSGIAGTGIGLNLVRLLVDGHEGSIDVVSQLGEGTTFTVRLPIDGPSAAEEENAGGASAAA